jgi:hypothetical protein
VFETYSGKKFAGDMLNPSDIRYRLNLNILSELEGKSFQEFDSCEFDNLMQEHTNSTTSALLMRASIRRVG